MLADAGRPTSSCHSTVCAAPLGLSLAGAVGVVLPRIVAQQQQQVEPPCGTF